nr:POZ-, AT hook-, and zinc finger-containing protein [Ipomoea batatas]
MWNLVKSSSILNESCSFKKLRIVYPQLGFFRYCHFQLGSDGVGSSLDLAQKKSQSIVGIFWDLDNKPPKTLPPFEAASKLRKAAEQFGFVKYMIAYANHHSFNYVPPVVRQQRKERKVLNELENKGVVKPDEPYICRVCGRRFYTNEKFINHFKQIHEREQVKRLNQIESAKGSRRVKLVAKYAMKMQKYKNAARDILTPKVGYGLADELKRAGFWVRTVSNKPEAADIALRDHLVDMMDKRRVDCVLLISDDSDFVDVLKEAKLRCLRTVVIGDSNDGALKRTADASFSWQEITMEKAKKEAVSVVGRWKDHDVLKTLEWTYDPGRDKKYYFSDIESEGSDIEHFLSERNDDNSLQKEDSGACEMIGHLGSFCNSLEETLFNYISIQIRTGIFADTNYP